MRFVRYSGDALRSRQDFELTSNFHFSDLSAGMFAAPAVAVLCIPKKNVERKARKFELIVALNIGNEKVLFRVSSGFGINLPMTAKNFTITQGQLDTTSLIFRFKTV